MARGTVAFFNDSGGDGFIETDDVEALRGAAANAERVDS